MTATRHLHPAVQTRAGRNTRNSADAGDPVMNWMILAVVGGVALGGGSALAQDRQDRAPEPAAQDAGSGSPMRTPDGAETSPGDGFGWAVRGAPASSAALRG
jgi:hypothetical protein